MIPVWRPRGDSNPRYRRERELPDGNLQKTQARIALQRALKHPPERLLNPYRTLAGYPASVAAWRQIITPPHFRHIRLRVLYFTY